MVRLPFSTTHSHFILTITTDVLPIPSPNPNYPGTYVVSAHLRSDDTLHVGYRYKYFDISVDSLTGLFFGRLHTLEEPSIMQLAKGLHMTYNVPQLVAYQAASLYLDRFPGRLSEKQMASIMRNTNYTFVPTEAPMPWAHVYRLRVRFIDQTTWDILILAVSANAVCTWIAPEHEVEQMTITLETSHAAQVPANFVARSIPS